MLAAEQFTIAFRVQKAWGALVALGLFLGGLGGGLFLISLFVGFGAGFGLGISATLLGALCLLLHLRRPQQFWRAVSRPGTSWISRGVISIAVFVGLGVVYIVPPMLGLSSLPWSEGTALGQAILAVAAFLALLIVVYTGFILSTPPAIAFWHNALLPALFSLYSLAGGLSFIYLWHGLVDGKELGANLQALQVGLMAAILISVLIYLAAMSSSTVAAKESLRLLVAGEFSSLFLGGVLLVGLIVPLLMASYGYLSGIPLPTVALAVIGIFDLIGGFLFRYSLLKSGLYAPIF